MISPDRAQQYMRVAKDAVLADAANWRHLPASRSALDALAHLDEGLKLAAINDGRIHPALTAADARRLGAAAAQSSEADSSTQRRDVLQATDVLRSALDRALQGRPWKEVNRVLADLLALVENTQRAYGPPLTPDDIEALYVMREELAVAERGRRFPLLDDVGKYIGVLRLPSSYPPWMGRRRTRAKADRMIRAIDKLLDGQAAGLLGVDILARARQWVAPTVGSAIDIPATPPP
jgi:hypothetical protein